MRLILRASRACSLQTCSRNMLMWEGLEGMGGLQKKCPQQPPKTYHPQRPALFRLRDWASGCLKSAKHIYGIPGLAFKLQLPDKLYSRRLSEHLIVAQFWVSVLCTGLGARVGVPRCSFRVRGGAALKLLGFKQGIVNAQNVDPKLSAPPRPHPKFTACNPES